MLASLLLAASLLLVETAPAHEEDQPPRASQPASQPTTGPAVPEPTKAAMNELWRRGACLLSSVYEPAEKDAVVPKDIGGLPVLTPRVIGRKGELLCYASDGQTLWTADDQTLYQVDAAAGRIVRQFGPADGLPDEPMQSILPAGGRLWLMSRGGLSKLDAGATRIEPVPGIRFNAAAMAAGGGKAWLFSDAGVWACPAGAAEWARQPDPPTRDRLSQAAGRGFWSPLWPAKVRVLIPSIFATDDGLFVICMNQLLRLGPAGNWSVVCDQAWQATPQGRTVWALTTAAVVRFDPAAGKAERFALGSGPAAGRPVAIAAADDAIYVLSQPDYDAKQSKFLGGGISRFDGAAWSVTADVGGTDVRFVTSLTTAGHDAYVACKLYDRVIQSGAHPGMAYVKKWLPHASGLGLLHSRAGGPWRLVKRENLKTAQRWVLGQKGTLNQDRIGPDAAVRLCATESGVWGVYQMVPEKWYSGYFVSAGCLARRDPASGNLEPVFDQHTDDLGLAGEQPELLLLSLSHGPQFVLGEGQPDVLGLQPAAGGLYAVCQSGLFVKDAAGDRFRAVVAESFRAYWGVTAAACDRESVWFGGDSGSLSRLDRRTGRLELVGVVPARKATGLRSFPDGVGVAVKSAKAAVVLPVQLATATRLPDGDTFVHDAKAWPGDSALPPPAKVNFACKGNYLMAGERRVAFIKGVFQPRVLCEDPRQGRLWLATYEGVASVPLPAVPASQPTTATAPASK